MITCYIKKIFICCFFVSFIFSEDLKCYERKCLIKDESITKEKELTSDKSLTNEKSLLKELTITQDKTITAGAEDAVGSMAVTVSNGTEDNIKNIIANVYFDTEFETYINDYGKWLKLVTPKKPSARFEFAKYFYDWQSGGQSEDFFSYSEKRTEQEQQIALCYDEAIKKFGIGTAIIATTWIVSFVLPGGSIYQTAILIIAKAATEEAIFGGAIGGIASCGIALFQGKTGNELIHTTVNGIADGYLIGAITGLVTGTGKVYQLANDIKKINTGTEIRSIYNGKVYDYNGNYLGKFKGELTEINGRVIINQELVGTINNNGIEYKWMLADDGNGNFFKIVNPDFTKVKLIDKIYTPPRYLWSNTESAKNWCQKEYLKDLADPNVESILGIPKKEAAMRLQYEKHENLLDLNFLKTNNLTKTEVNQFLKRYSGGAWHHLPESGKLIYVPKNHYVLAPHTGGDSFWGSKLTEESIEW